ncbi:MAG TPA: cytochrome b N-terminal domain-containing protein, partial [Pirellulales bacterium]|nr:cytochrome b N-terminal domain-containing protein [Pirellulales bacterium]
DGAYRAPREVNFWLGLILMQIVLGLSLTGYLLPWDQKGYWATRVATNLMGIVPGVGPSLQKLVVGGADYGHQTLTRFFALHAGVLPGLLVVFLVLHVALFRRHGIHTRQPHRQPDTTFWPDQVLKDAVACLAVLLFVLFFVIRPAFSENLAGHDYGDDLGAELGAPADPANEYSAARPEWYFLFLFQFLKLFEGQGATGELLGAIVVPGLIMTVLALMPLVGRWQVGHVFNLGFLVILLAGVGVLTAQALYADRMAQYVAKPGDGADERHVQRFQASEGYLKAVELAEHDAHRAIELAKSPDGIPPAGMLSVLRKDPKTQGPRLFDRYCASCHTHADATEVPEKASAPDLTHFATRQWITGLLDPDQIAGPHYFGGTEKHRTGKMARFVFENFEKPEAAEKQQELNTTIGQLAAAVSAEAALPAQRSADKSDAELIEAGRQIATARCTECHKFRGEGDLGEAPDLTGYGSYDWLKGMIGNPTHKRFYGDLNDRMPAFAEHQDKPESNIISPSNLDLLVRWLRGDWYQPGE